VSTQVEQNKDLVGRGLDEILNRGNWEEWSDTFAEDVVVHAPKLPAPRGNESYDGRAGLGRLFDHLREAYSDFHVEIQDLFGEGDRIAVRFTISGTNTGDWFGLPATGRSVSFDEVSLYRIVDGKIREVRLIMDTMEIGRQLGFVPEGPPPRVLIAAMRVAQRLGRLRRSS
jgi:steroid delta-isomerase-like uncharacterized protein